MNSRAVVTRVAGPQEAKEIKPASRRRVNKRRTFMGKYRIPAPS